MLKSLTMMVAQSRRSGTLPDFGVMRAMLFYVDEFPERLHHTKESALLFPRIRERVPARSGARPPRARPRRASTRSATSRTRCSRSR